MKEQENSRKMIRARADGKLISPRSPKSKAGTVAEDSKGSETTHGTLLPMACPPKGQINPKRSMKVRSDGRLASPQTETSADGNQMRRRGRPRKSRGPAGEGLIIIKYGKTVHSGTTTGQKIQEILGRPSPSRTPETKPRPASRSPKASKVTHPFFLGKVTQKPQQHPFKSQFQGIIDDSLDAAGGHENNASLTKRNSPRKAVANVNGGIRATMGSSGQNTIVFGSKETRRYPGASGPIWPPQGMIHVRPDLKEVPNTLSLLKESKVEAQLLSTTRKSKHVPSSVQENEDVLCQHIPSIEACKALQDDSERHRSWPEPLRLPIRRVMKGNELQTFYSERYAFHPSAQEPINQSGIGDFDELTEDLHRNCHTHPALLHLFHDIAESRTAFDRFACETYDWIHKYAPKKAKEILQPGQEAFILRDWLRSLTTNGIARSNNDLRDTENSMKKSQKVNANLTRKKRKRDEELDGFIVSGDEEADTLDELSVDVDPSGLEPEDGVNKRTVLRLHDLAHLRKNAGDCGKSTNAVVISGPSGCGKTAAVYAVAQELGFEVFEINAGSRRSGKDILDKVGDMSRNHLVKQTRRDATDQVAASDSDASRNIDVLQQNSETGRQGVMNDFLQPKKNKDTTSSKSMNLKKSNITERPTNHKDQMQSVILLEDVDILFEEDKQFWATTLELIVQSRRPIVMTCIDERLLPIKDLPLFGILRFRQPSVQLATEYLLLLACNEGHILSRDAVSSLYKAKCNDLRASITELQFFCQMALGDTKGGLEWMLIRPSTKNDGNAAPDRVVSDGTYSKGIGWVDHKVGSPSYHQKVQIETDIVLAVCNGWGFDLAEQTEFFPTEAAAVLPSTKRADNLEALKSLELAYDALSAADTLQCPGFRTELTSLLDATTPEMSEKDRMNYVEGSTLVQGDLLVDHSGTSSSIAAALRIFARRAFFEKANPYDFNPIGEQYIIENIPRMVQRERRQNPVIPQTLSTTFEPLSKPSRGPLASKGPLISSLDGPSSIIVEDLAPYIRTIVSYDLRLEEQRRQLDLASQNGRDGKRARTTRASRAALEGGCKANTRRERWFPANTDLQSILESGGRGWQEEALRRSTVEGGETGLGIGASRRSSTVSIGSRASGE